MRILKNKDIKTNILKKLNVGIIGFGNQARAQALNLKDSNIKVTIGLRKDSESISLAKDEGFNVVLIRELVISSDLICILIPDENIQSLFDEIKSELRSNQTLLFSHGYAVHFKEIKIPKNINVILVAPSGSGKMVREKFINDSGVPNLIAINQDLSGKSRDIALEYSRAIGGGRVGIIESSFEEEVVSDLFGEQVLLTGGIPTLIRESFKVLLEHGCRPEVAWLVCYYEVKSIVDSFHDIGLDSLNSIISNIAEYGGYTRGKKIINDTSISNMNEIIDSIKNGKFNKEWNEEIASKFKNLDMSRKKVKKETINEVTSKMLESIKNKKS